MFDASELAVDDILVHLPDFGVRHGELEKSLPVGIGHRCLRPVVELADQCYFHCIQSKCPEDHSAARQQMCSQKVIRLKFLTVVKLLKIHNLFLRGQATMLA